MELSTLIEGHLVMGGVSSIPEYVTGLEFLGYDSSGVTRDPKGVLRLAETSTRSGDTDSNFLEMFVQNYGNGKSLFDEFNDPREHKVGRTVLDAEVVTLAETIQETNNSQYFDYRSGDKERQNLDRFNMLRDAQKQVDESQEDPRVYRKQMGRLVNNPVIDGVEFTVDMAFAQDQLGEGTFPYGFLTSREYVVTKIGDNRKVLANRYGNDPRVVVAGTFEGDVRKLENYSAEIDLESKGTLMRLFRQLVPEIHEVTFPDNTRIRTD